MMTSLLPGSAAAAHLVAPVPAIGSVKHTRGAAYSILSPAWAKRLQPSHSLGRDPARKCGKPPRPSYLWPVRPAWMDTRARDRSEWVEVRKRI